VQASFSDGNEFTQFRLGAGFNKQTNVFSENLFDRRGSLHFDVNHLTRDKKWNIELTGFYSTDENKLISLDLTQYLKLPPNIKLYDSLGNLNWSEGGVYYSSLSGGTNPLAELLKRYTATTDNLNSNLQLSYRPFPQLEIKSSFGYNSLSTDEVRISPRASLSPATSILASSSFGNSSSSSWIIEPQLNYRAMIRKSKLSLLLGTTFQNRSYNGQTISASNYTSDLLLNSLAAAGNVSASNTEFLYRYMAVFGRLNYNIRNKYLFNLSARRDGSSRFGPDKRFSNFGAIGAAWLFSSESWFSKNLPLVSYGKVRVSYGVTGNDQIGDYRYLDLWSSVPVTYQGQPGLAPNNLFNPDYSWEINKKAEMGLDLGLLNNRIVLSASYFRNRSGNQLINYSLPVATGFNSVIKNFPALVQNEGWEGVLNARVISGTKFNWSSSVNITIPKNKLIAFPGLASTGYAAFLKIGEPLSNIIRYRYLGVDPTTGVYQFDDIDKDGKISSPNDFQPVGNTDPKFYGGWQNEWHYKGVELSVFFEFKKQRGKNYLALFYTNPPGLMYNQPQIVLTRWQKPGDITDIQKFTQLINVNNPAYGALVQRINNSDAIYSDASFIRCKNIALSYTLPASIFKRIKASSTLFLQGQNLFSLTNYLGSDPETQNILVMPPLRTLAGGIKLQF
jgi:TonB-dependent starch-binding outer membrane protein SusC